MLGSFSSIKKAKVASCKFDYKEATELQQIALNTMKNLPRCEEGSLTGAIVLTPELLEAEAQDAGA